MQNPPQEQQALQAVAGNLQAAGLAVSLSGVSKHFGANTVLDNIELQLRPGEFVAIVGRSGCGKSTLLRLVAGLDQVQAGQLTLDGTTQTGPHAATRLMFQDARLLPWRSIERNVGLGLGKQWQTQAHAALQQVGLQSRAGEWPANLSGGQKQRVALARALSHRPRLLLLDEPLGALDALTRIEMQSLIESLWQQHRFTALLVTHDIAEAITLADRVVLIEQGRVVLDQAITLPRPRNRSSFEFGELHERLLARVMQHQPAADVLPARLDNSPVYALEQIRWAV